LPYSTFHKEILQQVGVSYVGFVHSEEYVAEDRYDCQIVSIIIIDKKNSTR
jgi:hypothetical protein